MSRENVEIVRRSTEAYNRGDLEEASSFMDPGIEWDMSRVPVPDPGVYRGFDGLQAFSESWDESWEATDLQPEEFIEVGDQVVAVIRQVGRGRLSGADVEQRFAQLWTLRDGKIVRMEMHPNREAAVAAARRS